MAQLRESLKAAPVIWKGEYPYFIHPITDGVPRMHPDVLTAITELVVDRVDWNGVDLLLGIEAMGLPLTAPLSICLLYTSPSPRDRQKSRMPSSA